MMGYVGVRGEEGACPVFSESLDIIEIYVNCVESRLCVEVMDVPWTRPICATCVAGKIPGYDSDFVSVLGENVCSRETEHSGAGNGDVFVRLRGHRDELLLK